MRSSVAGIVGFVSELVNDKEYETFTQDRIQNALDAYRWEATQHPIMGITKRSTSGVTYAAYQTSKQWRYLEYDTAIEDLTYAAVMPDVSDYNQGRFQFSTPRTESYLYLTGFSHDPYAAAYSLLTNRAAEVSEEAVSWSTDGGSFNYGTLTPAITQQAQTYWLQSRAAYESSELLRSDANVF